MIYSQKEAGNERPEIDYLGPGEPPASAGKRLKGGRDPPTSDVEFQRVKFQGGNFIEISP